MKKGPKRQKGPQSVCKNSKLPKKQHNVSQKGPFLEISGLPRSLTRFKIYGARGDRSPRFLQPWRRGPVEGGAGAVVCRLL